ncbi:hypothetical protein FQR65_LT20915 [Abscondita terminalis]|nr:hypothetical protein FQR65_LT20915 [Abscondita terminalis]
MSFSFKFDSAQVPDLPKPRPYREIFVYGPRVEGTHLTLRLPVARGGPCAGGSSRRLPYRGAGPGQGTDGQEHRDRASGGQGRLFRQDAAGLARHHRQHRNNKIVAAGGCRAPRPMDDPAHASDGRLHSPPVVRRLRPQRAWGIHATRVRGVGQAPLPCAGHRDSQQPGTHRGRRRDMPATVFGNGIAAVAPHPPWSLAFDQPPLIPGPEPGCGHHVSSSSRERLFTVARSSWADYGCQSYQQGRRRVPPQPEVSTKITPQLSHRRNASDEARSMKAPVDLLWNGGIGTYVKAASEQHSDSATAPTTACAWMAATCVARWWARAAIWALPSWARSSKRAGPLLPTPTSSTTRPVRGYTPTHEVNIKILLNDVSGQEADRRAAQQAAGLDDR